MKTQIRHRYTDKVLFECEVPDNVQSGMAVRHALEKAVYAGAYLDGANLTGAYLTSANLTGANLDGAYLTGAYLTGANLNGAYLNGKILQGNRPIFQIGPIGSRCAYLVSYLTDAGVMIKAGCFTGTLDEFVQKVRDEHGDSVHGKEYLAAVELIKVHAELWEATKS